MTKNIEITLAQPIDGVGIEEINMDKYTDEVLSIIADQIDFSIGIDWTQNDGTAETKISFDGFDMNEEHELREEIEETVMLAEEKAYQNPDNYATSG